MEYAVFVIGTSDEVGGFFYDRLCVFHGDSKTGIFDHGQIIERGDHADLIKQKGTYYQLYTGKLELS